MATPICLPCIGLGCDNPDDLAAGIDGAIYSALDYSFLVSCPPLCFCPPSLFPRTISILASVIPPVIPPILEPGETITLRLQGCSALITQTLASGSTQSEIAAAAQSMQAEWAGQQALCMAAALPGVNCNTGESVSVCNDQQNFHCGSTGTDLTVPAGTSCQTLIITGLTQTQIDAATAVIKANLNNQVINAACGYLCPITESFSPGGGDIVTVNVHNVGAINFDSSSFQLCHPDGATCFNSVTPSVGPGATVQVISISQAFFAGNGFIIKFKGVTIFADNSAPPVGNNRTVLVVSGC
jgi:hypothetical protein